MKKVIAFINRQNQKPPLKKALLLVVLVLIFLPHWFISYHTIQRTIAPDLLLRTIGSRLQEACKPIYQYQWKLGDPTTWLNPYPDTRFGLNGVISTPFTLRILQPLANLNYCTIRMIWGCVQELFLFATIWFSLLIFSNRLTQLSFLVIASIFFIYDRNWMLNIYNGQMYIIYAFTFSLSGYLAARYRSGKMALLLLPITSIVRPFFITAIIPFLKFKKQHVRYLAISAVIAFSLALTTTSINEWKQYNSAMKLYAKEQTHELAMDTTSPKINRQYADACTKKINGPFTSFGAGCLYSLQHYLYLCRVSISNVQAYQVILLMLLLVLWWIGYKRNWLSNIPHQLLLAFLFYQLCELITPASRNPYNMIQWLPAVAWMIAWGNKQIVWLILLGLCLNHDIPFSFKYEREIGETFLFIALMYFLFRRNTYNNISIPFNKAGLINEKSFVVL